MKQDTISYLSIPLKNAEQDNFFVFVTVIKEKLWDEKNVYNKFIILQIMLMFKNLLYRVRDKQLRKFLKNNLIMLMKKSIKYIIDYDLDKNGLNKLAFYLEEEFYFEEKR